MKYVLLFLLPITGYSKTLYGIVIGCPPVPPKGNPATMEYNVPCSPRIKYVASDSIEKAIKLVRKGEKEEVRLDKFETLGELIE